MAVPATEGNPPNFPGDLRGDIWDEFGPTDHRIQARNVVVVDGAGVDTAPSGYGRAKRVRIRFDHGKADQAGRGDVVTLARSGHKVACPVRGAVHAHRARAELLATGSLPRNGELSAGISARRVTKIIKNAASSMGLIRGDYALHSVRIGYATALFEAGYDELVIRLAGRWSSSCVALYTRVSGKALLGGPRAALAHSL